MATLVKTLRSGGSVQFDFGRFDHWCVYLKTPKISKFAPTDTLYFSRLEILGKKHGFEKIYQDFVSFYILTDKLIRPSILTKIENLADTYASNTTEIEAWFTVIYAGMIAEENKHKAILKKRIKRLGMHQTLIDRIGAEQAAQFSKGKKWRVLDALMKEKGF